MKHIDPGVVLKLAVILADGLPAAGEQGPQSRIDCCKPLFTSSGTHASKITLCALARAHHPDGVGAVPGQATVPAFRAAAERGDLRPNRSRPGGGGGGVTESGGEQHAAPSLTGIFALLLLLALYFSSHLLKYPACKQESAKGQHRDRLVGMRNWLGQEPNEVAVAEAVQVKSDIRTGSP